jgi:chromosome segregation ATPase
MKNSLLVFAATLFLSLTFSNGSFAQNMDKDLKKQLKVLEDKLEKLEKQLDEVPEKTGKIISGEKNTSEDLKKEEAKNAGLNDTISKLRSLLASSQVQMKEALNSVSKLDSSNKLIEGLRKEIKQEKSNAEMQISEAARSTKAAESAEALKKNESIARSLLQTASLIEPASINELSGTLPASSSLKAQLTTLEKQSQILSKALLFLEEGKGVFTIVYEDLKLDFDKNTFPAQFELQQKIKRRYTHFLKSARMVAEYLEEINDLPKGNKLRKDHINNEDKFPSLIIDLYPYLRVKLNANIIENVSLGIDAKYLNIE